VHARPNAHSEALCGDPPDSGRWTRKKREVTCLPCLDEVIRRNAALVHYGRQFTVCGASGTKVSRWDEVTCPSCLSARSSAWMGPSR
jgi:hypothetical protein